MLQGKANLNPLFCLSVSQGLREGLLYEQLSNRYLKLTASIRKREKESSKAERDQV
jgi:hypothetical protein